MLFRFTGGVLEYTLIVLLLMAFLIRTSTFQTWLAGQAADYLSGELNTEVRIGKVDLTVLRDAYIEDVYIEDLHGDTLISAPRLKIGLSSFSLSKEKFKFSQVALENARVKLKVYEGEEDMNLQFLLDYFASEEPDTMPSTQKIFIDELRLDHAHFSYLDENATPTDSGMDFSNIDIPDLTIAGSAFGMEGDTIMASIDELSFADRSGFTLRSLTSNIRISPLGIEMEDLGLITSNSELHTKYLRFKTKSYDDFNDFENRVRMHADFLPTFLSMADIAYFVPDLWGNDQLLELAGEVKGSVNNIKSNFRRLQIGDTYIRGSFDISGLTEPESMFIAVSVDKLITSKEALEAIRVPPFSEAAYLSLPDNIATLGEISFSGSFMGFPTDFVAYGDMQTAIGRIKSDVKFLVDTANSNLTYTGNLQAFNFNLGRYYSIPSVGEVTADIQIDTAYGLSVDKDLHAIVNGNVTYAQMNGYGYRGITLSGEFENDFFFGDFAVHDPNIDMTFSGDIDFSKRIPQYDFDVSIDGANLYPLNLLKRDPSTSLCARLTVDASGDTPDNFQGKIFFDNLTLYEKGTDYDFGTIDIETFDDGENRSLGIISDPLSASIYGKYNFEHLSSSFQFLASSVMPSLFKMENITTVQSEEVFDFTVNIDQPKIITDLIDTNLHIAPYSFITGEYNSIDDEINLRVFSNSIYYGGQGCKVLDIQAEKIHDIVMVEVKANQLEIDDEVTLDNFALNMVPSQDIINSTLRWENNADNWGNILFRTNVLSPSNFDILVKESYFAAAERKWGIHDTSAVTIHSDTIDIQQLTIQSEGESLCLDGRISQDPNDNLTVSINSLRLKNLDPFMPDDYYFRGTLQGEATLGNLYNELYFSSNLFVDSLSLNEYLLGKLDIQNQWDNERKRITLGGQLAKKGRPWFTLSGYYWPEKEGEELAVLARMDTLNLEFLNAFLPQEDFSDLSGTATGRVNIKGSLSKPRLKGELDFKDGRISVEYLNTTYAFGGKVGIMPDMFTMDYIPISYKAKINNGRTQKGYLSGSLLHDNFSELSYDIFMDFENMLLMNTTFEQNPWFYGQAYASGYLTFFGFDENMEITVNAKTAPGTEIILPMYGSDEIVLQDFVSFVGDTAEVNVREPADLTGITMNLEVDLTRDATVEIQFDPAIGDIMRGKAEGHLSMGVDVFENFTMKGDLSVIEGDYLFTFYNVVNKRFEIRPGGTISWNTGDPYDAYVNLSAVYNVKAPLYDLMLESDERYKDNMPIECIMNLKEDLFNPTVNFDIQVPKADANIEGVLSRIRQDEAELNKQVFSLMVINRFMPPSGETNSASNTGVGGAFTTTTAEFLNNQLSRVLSDISDEFDIGFNYKPGDDISNEEVALAFETQLLNDRLVLSGNFGVSYGHATSTSNGNTNQIIGDFSAEYKVNDDGTFRVRAFNESNEFDLTNTSQAPFTQGIGVYYREEFDKVSEIKLFKKLFGRKKKDDEDPDTDPQGTLPENDPDSDSGGNNGN